MLLEFSRGGLPGRYPYTRRPGSADGRSPASSAGSGPRGVRDGSGDPPIRRSGVADGRERDQRVGSATHALARDLLDTVQAPGRAGVAAPQIGVALRAFAYNVNERSGVLLNPVLVATEGEQYGDEGCLSVPELWFPTRRSWYAAVEGFDQDGNQSWKARS